MGLCGGLEMVKVGSMKRANRMLVVTMVVATVGASGAHASLFRHRKAEGKPAATTAAGARAGGGPSAGRNEGRTKERTEERCSACRADRRHARAGGSRRRAGRRADGRELRSEGKEDPARRDFRVRRERAGQDLGRRRAD